MIALSCCWVSCSNRTPPSVSVCWRWWSALASTCVCTCWGGRRLSRCSWYPIIMKGNKIDGSLGPGPPAVQGTLPSTTWPLGLRRTSQTCCQCTGMWPQYCLHHSPVLHASKSISRTCTCRKGEGFVPNLTCIKNVAMHIIIISRTRHWNGE